MGRRLVAAGRRAGVRAGGEAQLPQSQAPAPVQLTLSTYNMETEPDGITLKWSSGCRRAWGALIRCRMLYVMAHGSGCFGGGAGHRAAVCSAGTAAR